MKEQSPEKTFLHLLKPTETNKERVKKHMGLFIALIEATAYQMQEFITFTERAEKQQLKALKSHIDAIVQRHKLAEKLANPNGFESYEESFDVSAEIIIKTLQAMRKGELQIVDCTEAA